MEGVLVGTTTTIPALTQEGDKKDNSLSTLSGLIKKKQIGQLDAISNVRSFKPELKSYG